MTEMTKLEVMNAENPRCAERIMAAMGGIDIPASVAFFRSRGGFCDCEILLNIVCDDDKTPPETLM